MLNSQKRREANRQLPQVAGANEFGFNRGSALEKERVTDALVIYSFVYPEISVPDFGLVGTQLADETVGSVDPVAVDAAWR